MAPIFPPMILASNGSGWGTPVSSCLHLDCIVRKADRILVMDQGRIVEQGRHEELLEAQGLYREIYELQLKSQEDLVEVERIGEIRVKGSHNPVKVYTVIW